MVSAKALAKQLSVLEIPDGPYVLLWRTTASLAAQDHLESICEALRAIGKSNGVLAWISPGEDLALLSDEDLARMGLQRKA